MEFSGRFQDRAMKPFICPAHSFICPGHLLQQNTGAQNIFLVYVHTPADDILGIGAGADVEFVPIDINCCCVLAFSCCRAITSPLQAPKLLFSLGC